MRQCRDAGYVWDMVRAARESCFWKANVTTALD